MRRWLLGAGGARGQKPPCPAGRLRAEM